ncbi:endoribonuclease L-PSP [Stachybotrys elegans]|uniref:Endoribonuclease L-PSP n=1 Tax=Stachybotrys elegans TaxID=80388 RepID=A0A8K0WSC5_9HYPO|nr:endoribonuclease L-PSP [Stachybotrys elegans]
MMSSNLARAAALLLAATSSVLAHPRPLTTHLGDQGPILSGGVATKDLVYVSGTVPTVNGTIPEGVEAQTAVIIDKIAAIFEEAGTSWENALKTSVFLANMDDFAAMNGVYSQLIPNPKPARTTIQAGRLPGNFLVEIEAVAAIPRC